MDNTVVIDSIHPLQQRMMDFYRTNPRCVIHAPRRSGKSILLIMQAMLSDKHVDIVVGKQTMVNHMKSELYRFCADNDIEYVSSSNGLIVNDRNVRIVTYSQLEYHSERQYHLDNDTAYMFDEYLFNRTIRLPLHDIDNVLLIGTPFGDLNDALNPDYTGVFAALIVNDGDE